MDDRLQPYAALIILCGCCLSGCAHGRLASLLPWTKNAATCARVIEPKSSSSTATQQAKRKLKPDSLTEIQLASHDEPLELLNPLATAKVAEIEVPELIAPPQKANEDIAPSYPIDLANALRLGGASNLEVRLARSRIAEAQARYLAAKVLWLPSIRYGLGYNKHDGRIQATDGSVNEVSRNSLFYGGGAGLGHVPLAGGAGGPFRFAVNLSLADAAFAPLVERQLLSAAGSASNAALNDNLLAIASAYFGLVEAHGLVANQREAVAAAENMVGQVAAFKNAGYSSNTELQRVETELASRRRLLADAQRRVIAASAELARLLRLPPEVELAPVEEFVLPVTFYDESILVETLIVQARAARPEVIEANSRLQAACWRTKQEKWRPWLPNVQAGASAGSFGGGMGSDYENEGSRSDVDLLAVWELRNVGAGNVALRREAASQYHQRELELQAVRDLVAAETVAAYADVQSFARQLEITEGAIRSANASYRLNAERIQAGEGLPIELIQSLNALAQAQDDYTEVVANYNRAQYRLMRAVGEVPAASEPVEEPEVLP